MMTPTAVSQIIEQLLRVVVMLGAAYMLLPYGLGAAAGGASMGAGIGAFGALVVLMYYYYKLPKSPEDAHKQPEGPGESSGSIVKRLIKLAIPISLASLMLPLVSKPRFIHRSAAVWKSPVLPPARQLNYSVT